MKAQRVRNLIVTSLVCGLLLAVPTLAETVDVTVDPGLTWIGYMNVFELPANGGAYLWGSSWGTPDLPAVFNGDQLELAPNTNVYNATDPYWANPDGSGAKWMNANMYTEDLSLVGKTISFTGLAVENTLVSPYVSQAFIKVLDPAQGYATIAQVYAPLISGQGFSLQLAVDNTAGLIPQYGFVTEGPDADPATVGALGHVLVTAVPEPAAIALLGMLALVYRRR